MEVDELIDKVHTCSLYGSFSERTGSISIGEHVVLRVLAVSTAEVLAVPATQKPKVARVRAVCTVSNPKEAVYPEDNPRNTASTRSMSSIER